MRIFITGGMGFVGATLTNVLSSKGHQVTILDRHMARGRPVPNGVRRVEGDSTKPGSWRGELSEHDVIINLAGASIFQRWNRDVKKAIYQSRILTTRNVVEGLRAGKGQETHLLSASGVGFYGPHGDEVLDESQSPGSDFLAQLAADWEREALKARQFGARVVLCRFGIVLGRNGGVLGQLVPTFRRYLGSPLGSGTQWVSWIHEQDLANVFLFLLAKPDVEGPMNCATPHPVRNSELTRTLGEVLNKPVILPHIPGAILKLILGEFGDVVLTGQRAVPKKLLDHGFRFQFPTIKQALEDLLKSQ